MGIFDTIKNLLSGHGVQLPENLDTQQELTDQVKQVISEKVGGIDQITEKIPGQADDNAVDAIKQKLGQ